jgi:methionine synthase II (cobalamin-independent)
MTSKLADLELNRRLARELERERHERALHDEQRAGLAVDEEFRRKDARENPGASKLKRPSGR